MLIISIDCKFHKSQIAGVTNWEMRNCETVLLIHLIDVFFRLYTAFVLSIPANIATSEEFFISFSCFYYLNQYIKFIIPVINFNTFKNRVFNNKMQWKILYECICVIFFFYIVLKQPSQKKLTKVIKWNIVQCKQLIIF